MTADEAKAYLKSLGLPHPERIGEIDYLNPILAVRLATAIQAARQQGIQASLISAYREPSVTKSSYDEEGYSSHAYGLAVDIGGIGAAGSQTALAWKKIAENAGLSSPYNPNGKEYNHWQIGPRLELPGSAPLLSALEAAKKNGAPAQMWAAYDPIRYPNESPGVENAGQGPTNVRAAALPGQDFYHTAMQHESGGKNIQNAAGADAWGYYQFTTPTWNGIRNAHPELNLPARPLDADYAQQTAAYRVFVQNNVNQLQSAGVPINDQNVFMASFLGAGGAIKFLKAMAANPNASAAELFPKEAAANPTVFMQGDHPLSLASVFAKQTGAFGTSNTTGFGPNAVSAPDTGAPGAAQTPPAQPPSDLAQIGSALGSALSGLVGDNSGLTGSPGTFLDASQDQPAIRTPALGADFMGPAPDPVPVNIAAGAGASPLGAQLGSLAAAQPDPALENPLIAPSITAGAPSMTSLLGGVGGAQPGNIYDPRRPTAIQPGLSLPRLG
jgi:hypothetical protein